MSLDQEMVWQQAIGWANVELNLCRHMVSLHHSELNDGLCSILTTTMWYAIALLDHFINKIQQYQATSVHS